MLIQQPIGDLTPPFYLSVLHLQAMPRGRELLPAVYKSFLFAFEASKPFKLLRIGQQGLPLVTRRSVFQLHVAFVAQMILEEERVKLLYGVGDARAQYLELPIEKLKDYL